MLEGYTPIDFSSVFPPMDLGQTRNSVGLSQAAMGILANSQWNQTPISSLMAQGLNSKGEAPKRQQTLIGRAIDLLSAPTYAIANAADDAIAGHQNNDNDSTMADLGQIIGGIATGAGRGIGTGLRGAFMPSETAANPQDKIYLGDALIRGDTGLSAEEAAKPENIEVIRKTLQDRRDSAFGKGNAGAESVTDADVAKYLKEMNISGIVASGVTDPLNFVGGPKGILSGVKGAAEIPEAAADISKILPDGAPINTGGVKDLLPKSGSYKVDLGATTPGKIANPATGELVTPPDWFDFPASAASMGDVTRTSVPVAKSVNELDPLDSILGGWAAGSKTLDKIKKLTPVAKVPDDQLRIANKLSAPEEISKLTGDLLRRVATGDAKWAYNVVNRLSVKYPGVPFTQTNKLIEHIAQVPDFAKRIANPTERAKIVSAFSRVIKADAAELKVATPPVKSAAELINEATKIDPVNLERLVNHAKPGNVKSKNPTRDTAMADATVAKFADQILGNAQPAGIKNPSAYAASVASGRTVKYSGSQQVQMWNHITHTMKDIKSPNRFSVAQNVLRQVEDIFMSKGATPLNNVRSANSVPLRLSQVLEAIGPAAAAMNPTLLTKILRGEPEALRQLSAEVIQRIEAFKAGEAIVDGTTIVKGVEAGSKSIEDLIKGPISAARMEEIVTVGSRVAEDITRAAGGSSVAAKQAMNHLKENFIPKSAVDTAVNSAHLNTLALISHPNVSASLLKKYSSAPAITRAINKETGWNLKALSQKVGLPALSVEWLGARFNAAYKNADMRPIYLRNAATAKSTVARRAEYLNNLAKTFKSSDLDLWNDALKGAQGVQEPLAGSQALLLSDEIRKVMENTFGSSGLKVGVALENSVVGRSQLLMRELNDNLKRFGLGEYQFAKKGDYAEGAAWLNSWEKWDIKKPLEFMFKIQNVVEHTVREKIMFDEIAQRFGVVKASGEFKQTIKHPRLQGYYFGSEAASQINQFVKNLNEISKVSSKTLQNFDKVVSKWKAGVTIYVPSHHIRNLIGDTYFNWIAGVNSARPYGTALKVMTSQRNRYEGIEELGNLTDINAVKRAMSGGSSTAAGKQIALTMQDGTKVTNDMVYTSAFQQGILPTTRVLEDIPDDAATALDKFKPLGGKGQKVAHTISEGRDHYVRLAHYVDVLKKSSKPFEAATEEAAAVVRKWHPDGMDLTSFERNVMRRAFPFYSWTRKALPLIIESMVATPGKVMVYPKAQYALQNMMGIDTGPMSDPFPYDQLFPNWIREKGIGPISGSSGNYTVANPSNPTLDMIAQLNNPGKMGMGMLNPVARIPIELATGAEAQTGAPIGGITDTDYLAKQLPGISHAGRITGEFGVSDTTKANSSGYNLQNIFNMITALNVQNTGPYQKSAEFDLREYLKNQRG